MLLCKCTCVSRDLDSIWTPKVYLAAHQTNTYMGLSHRFFYRSEKYNTITIYLYNPIILLYTGSYRYLELYRTV